MKIAELGRDGEMLMQSQQRPQPVEQEALDLRWTYRVAPNEDKGAGNHSWLTCGESNCMRRFP